MKTYYTAKNKNGSYRFESEQDAIAWAKRTMEDDKMGDVMMYHGGFNIVKVTEELITNVY